MDRFKPSNVAAGLDRNLNNTYPHHSLKRMTNNMYISNICKTINDIQMNQGGIITQSGGDKNGLSPLRDWHTAPDLI